MVLIASSSCFGDNRLMQKEKNGGEWTSGGHQAGGYQEGKSLNKKGGLTWNKLILKEKKLGRGLGEHLVWW